MTRTQVEKDAYAAGALNYCETMRNGAVRFGETFKTDAIPISFLLEMIEMLEGLATKVSTGGSDV